MEGLEPHLAGLVEAIHAEVRDDDRRPTAQPAALAADPLGLLRAAHVARRGPEVDPLDEAARALAHDHEHLAGVDGDLARPAGPGQARRRVCVVPDHGRVDVAEPVDLGCAEEPDVDQPALQVIAEQLEHRDHGRRTGHDRRVADRQRQAGGPRPEHARLVDELEVRRHGPLGEVDRDVRQADADEADVFALERPCRGHDHHLGLRESHRCRSPSVPGSFNEPTSERGPRMGPGTGLEPRFGSSGEPNGH